VVADASDASIFVAPSHYVVVADASDASIYMMSMSIVAPSQYVVVADASDASIYTSMGTPAARFK